ncbi:MAG: hypothetical protein M3R08_12435, partial [Bacteroidota bacterium]|nr:hypothetical protein [Bacteroidota bacterium]
VEIGLRTENKVQLISGVQPGDTVVTSGLLAVRDGMALRPAEPRSIATADSAPDSSITAE